VDQLVTLTGTVAKLTQEDASFGVSGTVKKVEVAAGDKVTVGDTLAELDTSDLDAAVTAAKATLARAKAQLETDSAAADDTSSSSSSSSSGSKSTATPSPSPTPTTGTGSGGKGGTGTGGTGTGGTGTGTGGTGTGTGAGGTGTGGTGTTPDTTVGGVDLAAPTNAVVTALAKATTDLDQVATLISARDSACNTVLNGGGDTSTPDPTPSDSPTGEPTDAPSDQPTDSPTDSPTDAPTDAPSDAPTPATETSFVTTDASSADDLQACITAMKAVSDLQDQVNTDQIAVQTKETALKTAMDQAVAALKAQATTGTGTTGTGTSGTGGTGTGTGATGTGGTGTKGGAGGTKTGTGASAGSGTTGGSGSTGGGRSGQTLDPVDQAARVAVDNASILAAQAALDSAHEDVDEAVLTAPIDGVVGTVGITKGESASTSNTITILGNGAVKVTLDVPQATAAKLKKGMTAQVTADGATAPSDGVVDSIGIMPSSSSGSSTYPVVIVVNKPADGLAEGAAATVAITLKAVAGAVTVPNSAVTSTGSGATGFVTLLQDGKTTRQVVTTGAVGTTVTQIVSGLTAGQTVVLADSSADVPASSTTANTNRGFGGGGTFGGGAGGAGGFGGATAGGGRANRGG
jgi:multidrug efflux pump subunit AcrA (membrane-fusion protein)